MQWRLPGTNIYRSVKQETEGAFIPGVFIARIGSSLYFANAAYVKDTILAYLSDLEAVDSIQYVVLEMTPVVSIDSTALHMIHDLVHNFHANGVNVAFCMVGNRVMKTMVAGKLPDDIGKQWFFRTVDEAVNFCVKHQQVLGQSSDIRASQDLSMRNVQVRLGNQIGFSTDLRGGSAATSVYIILNREIPGIIADISDVFKRNRVSIIRASVEPISDSGYKHSYTVVGEKSRSQLKDWEIGLCRDDLQKLLDSVNIACLDVQPATHCRAGSGDLERGAPKIKEMLNAHNEKLDALKSLMAENSVALGHI